MEPQEPVSRKITSTLVWLKYHIFICFGVTWEPEEPGTTPHYTPPTLTQHTRIIYITRNTQQIHSVEALTVTTYNTENTTPPYYHTILDRHTTIPPPHYTNILLYYHRILYILSSILFYLSLQYTFPTIFHSAYSLCPHCHRPHSLIFYQPLTSITIFCNFFCSHILILFSSLVFQLLSPSFYHLYSFYPYFYHSVTHYTL